MFILAAQRDGDVETFTDNWRRYREYLDRHRERFPAAAYELATSSWYYNFDDHRCPHDSWLEEAILTAPAQGKRREIRAVSLRLRLLGAYHDGHIELRYPRVFGYHLTLIEHTNGHGDWLYDEFRVDDSGRLVHEIEWAGRRDTARWLITADDVKFVWRPLVPTDGLTAG